MEKSSPPAPRKLAPLIPCAHMIRSRLGAGMYYFRVTCVVRIGTSVCESPRYVPPRTRAPSVSSTELNIILEYSVYASGLAPLGLPPSAFAVLRFLAYVLEFCFL